jgi:hypothetical protein
MFTIHITLRVLEDKATSHTGCPGKTCSGQSSTIAKDKKATPAVLHELLSFLFSNIIYKQLFSFSYKIIDSFVAGKKSSFSPDNSTAYKEKPLTTLTHFYS